MTTNPSGARTAIKTFKYKMVPNKRQGKALQETLDSCRDVWNMALEQRKYQRTHWAAQCKEITQLRALFPEYQQVHVHVLQNVVKKLHRSFQWMREIGAGFPRFKSARRYHSFSFNNVGFRLAGRHLQVSKIGNVKIRLSRELPIGACVKSLTVKKTVSGWYAFIVVDAPVQSLAKNDSSVGIDVGIENFAALSDGTMIPNPKYYEHSQAAIRTAQRRVQRRIKGSHRRLKAVVLLRKVHEGVANRRADFLHKQTTAIVQKFGIIVIESLNVKGLSRGILSKQVLDASWSQFFNFLTYKAAEAGRQVIGVSANYTSQICPKCGARKKKALSMRQHKCPDCGYTAHRDTAAAQVILARMEPLNAKIGD